jgi:hypothetical protein
MTVTGTVQYPQLILGAVAQSYIPNPGISTQLRTGDSEGPGAALVGANLTAAFPAGLASNTIVIEFTQAVSSPTTEVLLALSAGTTYNTGNGLMIRTTTLGLVAALGNVSGAATSALSAVIADGVTVNKVAVSWDVPTQALSLSINGQTTVVSGAALDFKVVGTTALILGSLTYAPNQATRQVRILSVDVKEGYRTGPALQALTFLVYDMDVYESEVY